MSYAGEQEWNEVSERCGPDRPADRALNTNTNSFVKSVPQPCGRAWQGVAGRGRAWQGAAGRGRLSQGSIDVMSQHRGAMVLSGSRGLQGAAVALACFPCLTVSHRRRAAGDVFNVAVSPPERQGTAAPCSSTRSAPCVAASTRKY
ncbi:unnamed protein product [Lota lota]